MNFKTGMMKQMNLQLRLLVACCLCSMTFSGAQASVWVDGLYFNLDISRMTAGVTYISGSSATKQSAYVSGDLVIPSEIVTGGNRYTVTSVDAMAFKGCRNLTSVVISKTIQHIDWLAFADCPSLTSVTIPRSLDSIADDAFSRCVSLNTVRMKTSDPPALRTAELFKYAAPLSVIVPYGSKSAYRAAVAWKKFKIVEELPPAKVKAPVDTIRSSGKIKDGFYYIESAYPEFFSRQGVHKAMCSVVGDTCLYWGTLDPNVATFIFYVKKEADGNYSVRNLASNMFISTHAESARVPMTPKLVAEQRFVPLGDDQYNIVGVGSTYSCHTQGYLEGYGDIAYVITWNGLKDSGSAWYLIPAGKAAKKIIVGEMEEKGER